MSFKPLSFFLQKFALLRPSDESLKRAVSAAIEDEVGASVPAKNIKIERGTAFIQGNGALKSEIFLKKNRILEKARDMAPGKELRDIR